jgi:hypothetical protein
MIFNEDDAYVYYAQNVNYYIYDYNRYQLFQPINEFQYFGPPC